MKNPYQGLKSNNDQINHQNDRIFAFDPNVGEHGLRKCFLTACWDRRLWTVCTKGLRYVRKRFKMSANFTWIACVLFTGVDLPAVGLTLGASALKLWIDQGPRSLRRHRCWMGGIWEASEPSYGWSGVVNRFGTEEMARALAPVSSAGHATRKHVRCVKGAVRRRDKRCGV
jgi:hypothetical protein